MPTYSNQTSDTNEQRFANYLLENNFAEKVDHLGRFATADMEVTTPDGRVLAVEFKRRKMPNITHYDRFGGLTISTDKIDKMEELYRSCDSRRWVVECDRGYYWIDIENRIGTQQINRTKLRPGFDKPGTNDSEPGYAYLGSQFKRIP